MPKRLMLVLAVAALAIAACHSNGSVSPTPSGTPVSPNPNPSITKATVSVTIFGTPAPRIPVEESTPQSKTSPRPGKPFETKLTGKKGLVHFKHLKPSATYCWVAVLGPHQTSSECAGWAVWQNGIIDLGT
jgi:hypothetical protein